MADFYQKHPTRVVRKKLSSQISDGFNGRLEHVDIFKNYEHVTSWKIHSVGFHRYLKKRPTRVIRQKLF